MRVLFSIMLVLAIAPPSASFAQTCEIVPLEASFKVGELRGIAPTNGITCFDLRIPKGQNMSIELANGQNVSISVPGYYDDRTDRMFIGDLPERLEVRVFQLMRSATPQPFTVRVRFEPPGNG